MAYFYLKRLFLSTLVVDYFLPYLLKYYYYSTDYYNHIYLKFSNIIHTGLFNEFIRYFPDILYIL